MPKPGITSILLSDLLKNDADDDSCQESVSFPDCPLDVLSCGDDSDTAGTERKLSGYFCVDLFPDKESKVRPGKESSFGVIPRRL